MAHMSELERALGQAMLGLYEKWKEVGYTARRFKRMLTPTDPTYKGPVGTVRHLLSKRPKGGSGFDRLVEAGKADWTIEALVAHDRSWHELFARREIEAARERLRAVGA